MPPQRETLFAIYQTNAEEAAAYVANFIRPDLQDRIKVILVTFDSRFDI